MGALFLIKHRKPHFGIKIQNVRIGLGIWKGETVTLLGMRTDGYPARL